MPQGPAPEPRDSPQSDRVVGPQAGVLSRCQREEVHVPVRAVLTDPAPALLRPAGYRPAVAVAAAAPLSPVRTDGRHLAVDGAPWRLRAVTYGSFLPRSGDGAAFPEPARVRGDLATAAAAGFNTIRTYTLPPADLLDAAEEHGLRVLVGLHYDDWRMVDGTSRRASASVRDAGRRAVDEALVALDGRRCVAAVVVGNEVPGDLVRVHGPRRVEAVLSDLVARVHDGAPDLLATYANYPTTEYLQVAGQDLACMNVFLHDPVALRGYLQHLSVTTDLPLVVSELGVDAARTGPARQAEQLGAQLDVVDEVGCAGAAVFSLTDEWGVGGYPVEGWQFGLQDRLRSPRPAFAVAASWAVRPLRGLRAGWPSLTVVVCAYQEQERLTRCLTSLAALDYPDLEVVVCDDGSTDGTRDVARSFPFRLLELEHGGLSAARNAGTAAATGEIVAFLDADATCHPDWAYHLVRPFVDDPAVVGSGGPNLPVSGAGLTARAVALSPGNPVEVLTRPDRAEHVAGCNSAFRRDALLASGGYLPVLTSAGDDVDVCWRLLDGGGTVAFSSAAQVRHERRTTVPAYLRQQRGYGRAERMISGRHPHRFNRWGHATWTSSVYGGPLHLPRLLPRVIGYGAAGSAAYQPVVGRRGAGALQLAGLLVLPTVLLGVLGLLLGAFWTPALPAAAGAWTALAGYAVAVGSGTAVGRQEPAPLRLRCLTGLLHLLQPLARAWGGLRARPLPGMPAPDRSGDRQGWVDSLHVALAGQRCHVRRGGPHDRYDLRGSAGPLLSCRLTTGLRWGSAPVLTTRIRPRATLAAALVLVPVLSLLLPVPAPLTAAALVLAVATELAVLRSRLSRAVAQTRPSGSARTSTGTDAS
jgi:glycosyltransferase involved in cell wall biosynthesis